MGEAGLLHREKHLLRMHCRTEMLSWVSLTFAGVQADVNAVIEADFLLSFYRFLSRTWLTWGEAYWYKRVTLCQKQAREPRFGIKDLALDMLLWLVSSFTG